MTSRDSSVLAYGQPSLLHPWPYLSIVSECCRTRARQLLVSIAVEVSELRGVAFYLVSCCTEKCAIPVMNDSSLDPSPSSSFLPSFKSVQCQNALSPCRGSRWGMRWRRSRVPWKRPEFCNKKRICYSSRPLLPH